MVERTRPPRASERIEQMEEAMHCLYQAKHATHALLDVMADLGDKRTSLSGDDLYALLSMVHEKLERADNALHGRL